MFDLHAGMRNENCAPHRKGLQDILGTLIPKYLPQPLQPTAGLI